MLTKQRFTGKLWQTSCNKFGLLLYILSSHRFLLSDAFISWNSRRSCHRVAVILMGGRRLCGVPAWSPSHVLNKKWICANCNSETSERWKHHRQNCIYIKLHKKELYHKTFSICTNLLCKFRGEKGEFFYHCIKYMSK